MSVSLNKMRLLHLQEHHWIHQNWDLGPPAAVNSRAPHPDLLLIVFLSKSNKCFGANPPQRAPHMNLQCGRVQDFVITPPAGHYGIIPDLEQLQIPAKMCSIGSISILEVPVIKLIMFFPLCRSPLTLSHTTLELMRHSSLLILGTPSSLVLRKLNCSSAICDILWICHFLKKITFWYHTVKLENRVCSFNFPIKLPADFQHRV